MIVDLLRASIGTAPLRCLSANDKKRGGCALFVCCSIRGRFCNFLNCPRQEDARDGRCSLEETKCELQSKVVRQRG